MRKAKTTEAPRREGKLYLDKGIQFLEEAKAALNAARYDAALLGAIHAAISATDAVTVVLGGRRSSDPDHQRAVDLLEQTAASAPEVRERVRQLRALLARKNAVEYESKRASAKDALDGVERAGRVVQWAQGIVEKARV